MNRAAVAVLVGGSLAIAVAGAYAATRAAEQGNVADPFADAWADAWAGLGTGMAGAEAFTPIADEEPGTYATETGETGDAGGLIEGWLAPVAFAALSTFRANRRVMSPGGLAVLQRHEGFVSTPYRDPVGIWTIGYGHKILPGERFTSLTREEASELLVRDVNIAEDAVNAQVTVELTQAQFDALVSFVFNVGTGAFRKSTLLRLLNQGNYAAVPAQLARWKYGTKAGQLVELPGLVARRADEGQLFASGTGTVA